MADSLKIGITFTRCDECNKVEVVYGKWKLYQDGSATCNQCCRTTKNAYDQDSWFRYCPDCGARMIGVYCDE